MCSSLKEGDLVVFQNDVCCYYTQDDYFSSAALHCFCKTIHVASGTTALLLTCPVLRSEFLQYKLLISSRIAWLTLHRNEAEAVVGVARKGLFKK
jgi:hypothetical protein